MSRAPDADDFWGPEIVVNGVCPEWLAEREPYLWPKTNEWLDHLKGRHSYQKPFARTTREWSWQFSAKEPCIVAIRLPADHPAYAKPPEPPEQGK